MKTIKRFIDYVKTHIPISNGRIK